MPDSIVPFDNLLDPPIKRAAYSDRTAWIMAMMSKLAYIRFESATDVQTAVADAMRLITGKDNPAEQSNKISKKFHHQALSAIFESVANTQGRQANHQALEDALSSMKFTLIKTFSIHIPMIADTQAFLAKLETEGREPFLVLAFRGTEPKKAADIKADLHATSKVLGYLSGPGGHDFIALKHGEHLNMRDKIRPPVKVHTGFWSAFDAIKPALEKALKQPELNGLPLYIAGHSLGGALAIIATYALESDRVAACYTFGSPRVGNIHFGRRIRPPVYRVVNAADVVPRVPPAFIIDWLTIGLRAVPLLPYNEQIADFLERFRGYRHYGDMRYLKAAEPVANEDNLPHYPDLAVLSNPPQVARTIWLARRWIATWGKASVGDHDIDIYQQKLAYWAYKRSKK